MDESKKCFVLMPFDAKYKEVYTEVYKQVCAENGIQCWRVDEITRPGSITKDIIEGILEADLIITDLTSRNANVFYELGIAHAAGNKTIMTSQKMEDVPFDIANYRVILYEQTISGSKKLKEKLNESIKELLKALDRTNNPFQEVISRRSTFGQKSKIPLVKMIDLSILPRNMVKWLDENQIIYAEDVKKIDLEKLVNTPGLGEASLRKFLAQVVENDLYDNAQELFEIATKYRIRLKRGVNDRW